ncbi:transposase [Mycoplasma seminis]|uniref:Mutator family transposase n=1 Tax=Mycoplasma seminis TaxID=512749 RepID=A0ABY9H9Y1_9MOLU|nr:transposase [Mycoplasma seminis]WLP85404.1 transposase [Mycoplasma seminis]
MILEERNKLLRNEFYKLGADMRELSFLLNVNYLDVAKLIEENLKDEVDAYITEMNKYELVEGKIYRNGYSKRTLYTLNGKLQINVPRLRNASNFCSQILAKYKRCEEEFEFLIAHLLQQFLSYEQTIDLVEKLLGFRIGHSIIARVSKTIKNKYDNAYSFDINNDIYALFIDASYHKVFKWYNPFTGEYLNSLENVENPRDFVKQSSKIALYTAIAIDKEGKKQVLSIETSGVESTENWTKFLSELKKRGINDPQVVVCDDFSGINNVINSVFPSSKIQKCAFHKMTNALITIPQSKRYEVSQLLKLIFKGKNKDEGYKRFLEFKNKYKDKYRKAVAIIENSLDEIFTFYDFPIGIRRYIYTNNICENFHSALRKYVKKKARIIVLTPSKCWLLLQASK